MAKPENNDTQKEKDSPHGKNIVAFFKQRPDLLQSVFSQKDVQSILKEFKKLGIRNSL